MLDRSQLKSFREASWSSVEELRAFVSAVSPVSRRELEKLLGVLEGADDAAGPRHKNRCSAFKNVCLASPNRQYFEPMAKSMANADPRLCSVLAQLLPKVNDVEAHGTLCQSLGAEERFQRVAVAGVLEQLAGPSALRELTRLCGVRGFTGRQQALEVMLPKARHRALPMVEAILRTGSLPDKLKALELVGDPALMGGGRQEVIELLLTYLDSSDPGLASASFTAFSKLADEQSFVQLLEPRLKADLVNPLMVEALGQVRTKHSADLLTARLRRGPVAVQLAAIRALQNIGDAHVIEGLVEALHLEEPSVQRAASDALLGIAESGHVEMARLLLPLLSSPHVHIRRTASQLAATVDDPSGNLTRQLLSALRREDWWIRERVLDALVELRLPGLAFHLVGYLQDPSPVIRRYAIFGLLRLGDAAALGAILRVAAEDDDWWVRDQAVLATGELADARAIPFLEILVRERWDLRVAALEALQTLGAEDSLLNFAELTADEDASVRLTILGILRDLPRCREAAIYIQSCVNDVEPRVVRVAAEILDKLAISKEAEASASTALLDRLLAGAARHGADDLLLAPGRPPFIKHLGEISAISKGLLTEDEMRAMVIPLMSRVQREALADGHDVDLSYDVPGFSLRYRINVFRQLAGLSAVFRRIHQEVPPIDALGLPSTVLSFADYANGLVLVGGPTGSGKSTTLAALIDYINRHHGRHIVTIEDPIEVVHTQRESLINQREVGAHAHSFADALKATLRQDPDVILVGELRDRETIEFAVNAAETGHLVFATVHTTSAATSVDRLIHACEPKRQPLIRTMLAENLRAVLCQQLLRRADGEGGRVLACEVMLKSDAISNLVRKDKAFQIPSAMVMSAESGMQLMDDDLARLVSLGAVSGADARLLSMDKEAFDSFLEDFKRGRKKSVTPGRADSIAPPSGLAASIAPVDGSGRMSFVPPPREKN